MPDTVHSTESYRHSHTAPGKGESYDAYYESDPEARYLWHQERRVLARILDEYYGTQPIHLLDFACGTGRITSFLETRVASSVGVDVSDSMLQVARLKLRQTDCRQVDLLKERVFPNESFNLITAFRFFLNAEPALRAAAVWALGSLLSKDGCLVFNVHRNSHSLYYGPVRLWCRMRQAQEFVTLSIDECAHFLEEAGLRIVQVYPVGLLRLPKVRFTYRVREWIDQATAGSSSFGRISDNPIIVARHAN